MKQLIYIFATGILLASCGGNNTSDKSNKQDSSVEKTDDAISESNAEEQQTGYKPPFSITAQILTDGVEKKPLDTEIQEDHFYSRETYLIELYPNGRYKVQLTEEINNLRTGYRWWKNDPVQIEGTWTTLNRRLGEDYQKVYELRVQNNAGSFYLPEDCKFIYSNWDDCANFNEISNNAIDVISVSHKTGIIKNDDDDVDDGTPGPELWGLNYEGEYEAENDGETFVILMRMEFDRNVQGVCIYRKLKDYPDQEWQIFRNTTYTYKGKRVIVDGDWKGKITADGSSITFTDGFGETYSFSKVK